MSTLSSFARHLVVTHEETRGHLRFAAIKSPVEVFLGMARYNHCRIYAIFGVFINELYGSLHHTFLYNETINYGFSSRPTHGCA